MCQAKNDGGLRCPIHRYDSSAALKVAVESSGLTHDQAEKLFSDLRREGRSNIAARPNAQWNHILRRLRNTATSSEIQAKVSELTEKARSGSTPDNATLYALQRIVDRSQELATNLNSTVETLATKAGINNAEAKERFDAAYNAVDRSRKAKAPTEFTNVAVANAKAAGLPQDISTVVAIEKLRADPERGPRRITRIPVHGSAFLHEIGYDVDGGRLEVVFKSNTNNTVAYQNVPESLWDRMNESHMAGRVYSSEVRGNMDYQYLTVSEAADDGYTVRCNSCGQYRAVNHSCPTRTFENKLAEKGLSSDAAKVLAVMSDVDVESIDARTAAEIESDIAAVRAQIDEKNNHILAVKQKIADAQAAYQAAIAIRDTQKTTMAEEKEALAHRVEEESLAAKAAKLEASKKASMIESVPLSISGEDPHGNPAYVATIENQRHPVPFVFDESKTISETVLSSGFMTTTSPDNLERYGYNFFQYLSAGEQSDIENREPNDSFIVSYNVGDEVSAKIVKKYNSNLYNIKSKSTSTFYREQQEHRYTLTPRGRSPLVKSHTSEEGLALREAEEQRLAQAVADGHAVYVSTNNSMTRKYKLDGNMGSNQRLAFAKTSELRAAIKNGKIAVFNIEFDNAQDAHTLDDQGVAYQTGYYNGVRVKGNIGVRKNDNGVIEMVSKQESLRCNCYKYRNNYHCEHIDYVQRHIANAVQQSLPAERTNSLLTASLSGRGDVTVIENDPTRGTYISFGTEAPDPYSAGSNRRNRRYNSYHDNHFITHRTGNSTEDLIEVAQTRAVLRQLRTVAAPPNSAGIRQALARADVELPIRAEYGVSQFNRSTGSGNITGTMTLAKTNGELPVVKEHTLKCDCADYQENYDCQHVRATLTQPQIFTHVNMRSWSPDDENALDFFVRQNRDEIVREDTLFGIMQQESISRETAVTMLNAREENARIQQAERDRVNAERNRLYLERQREDDAARAERIRLSNEAIRVANETLQSDYDEFRSDQRQRWQDKDETYESNPAVFFNAYEQALKRKTKGVEAIPYEYENVTDGICADTPGARKFGIELEFDIKPGLDRWESLRQIGKELHESGLTTTAEQVGYHSAASSGWKSWSFEQDCTVDAELVSPILSDTPESWEQIAQVTEIIERNGGHATTRCGSHVHVSTGSYGLSTAKHAELLRTMNQNEDALFRLATNPAIGRHRGTRWCHPNTNDPENDIDADRQADHGVLAQDGHGVALNFESAGHNDFEKRNVEFRMWDASISASVIQQQVKVSAALTEYAERHVDLTKKSEKPKEPRQSIGHNRRREQEILEKAGTKSHTAETFNETNAGVATLIDKLFRRNEDKEGVVSLFAMTKWQ